MTKYISFLGYTFIVVQVIILIFILNPWQGVAFENNSTLAESVVLYPYIVYEDEEQIIISSAVIDNYWVYDPQGKLNYLYTIPGAGGSYAKYENDILQVYEVRTQTLYSITIGGVISSENIELSQSEMNEFKDSNDSDSTVHVNLLKQLIYKSPNDGRLVLERNSIYIMVFYVLSSLFITGALKFSYFDIRKQYTLQGNYQSILRTKPCHWIVMLIVFATLTLGYIASILLFVPIFLFALDVFYFQIVHARKDKKNPSE